MKIHEDTVDQNTVDDSHGNSFKWFTPQNSTTHVGLRSGCVFGAIPSWPHSEGSRPAIQVFPSGSASTAGAQRDSSFATAALLGTLPCCGSKGWENHPDGHPKQGLKVGGLFWNIRHRCIFGPKKDSLPMGATHGPQVRRYAHYAYRFSPKPPFQILQASERCPSNSPRNCLENSHVRIHAGWECVYNIIYTYILLLIYHIYII